jgi:DNA ligase-1
MKPMLAKPYHQRHVNDPGYLQPKLDGVRMIWTGEKALTRQGNEILGLPELVKILEEHFSGVPLDGELYCHGKSFQELIKSIRRTVNIQEDMEIEYHVYDTPVEDLTFEQRHQILLSLELDNIPRVVRVETIKAESEEDLNPYEAEGYEGTMWRSADGTYRFGKRSSDLLKIKTFHEDEFEIVGIRQLATYPKIRLEAKEPGAKQYADGTWYRNGEPEYLDACGALICQTEAGQPFEVGSGLTDELRQQYWNDPPIGETLTVKFQSYTDDGIPRFPIHKAIRDYE